MKNRFKFLGIVAIVAAIGLLATACDTGTGNGGNGGGFNVGDFFPAPEGNPTISVTITDIPSQHRGMLGQVLLLFGHEEPNTSVFGIPRGLIAATTDFDLASLERDPYYDIETWSWLYIVPTEAVDIMLMMFNPEEIDDGGPVPVFIAENESLSDNNTSIALSAFYPSGNMCNCQLCNCNPCNCDVWCGCA